MNEAHQQLLLNLALGRAYLAAHDPRLCMRTWQAAMDEMARHGVMTTQQRCARSMRSQAFDPIRDKPLVETTSDDFLVICHAHGNSVGHYLRRFHNLALNLGWLAWPVLHKAAWPKSRSQSMRPSSKARRTRNAEPTANCFMKRATEPTDPRVAIGNGPNVMEASAHNFGLVFIGSNARGVYMGQPRSK